MNCEVCDKEPSVGVASLPFAAMSVSFGRECLVRNAYPLWSVVVTIEINGGKNQCSDWFLSLNTYHNGGYIKVRDIPDDILGQSEEVLT